MADERKTLAYGAMIVPLILPILVLSPVSGSDDPPTRPEETSPNIIEGQVFNSYGAGVEGATVLAFTIGADDEPEHELAQTTSDRLGDFRLTLPATASGTVIVSIKASGFETVTRQIELIADDEFPPFVDVELAGSGLLRGKVLDAHGDKPLEGAVVKVSAAFKTFKDTSDADGVFKVTGLLPGQVELTVDARGHAREKLRVDIPSDGTGKYIIDVPGYEAGTAHPTASVDESNRIVLRLSPERIVHLRFVNEQAEAIPGVMVESLNGDGQDYRQATASDKGELVLNGLRFENHLLALRLSHDLYVSSKEFGHELELPADKSESTHTLILEPAGTVTGLISDIGAGQPLNGARILVGDEGYDRSPRDWTGFDGKFRITGATPGEQVVTVHLAGHAPELKTIRVEAGKETQVKFKLQAATVVGGVVVDAEGKPLANVHLGASLWRGSSTLGLQAMTDENGQFLFRDAPVDKFQVIVRHRAYEPLRAQVLQPGKTDHQLKLTEAAPGPGVDPGAKFKVGDNAPEFELVTLEGRKIKLSELKGKVVFLDFWATWCGPCVAELPNVKKVHQAFGQRSNFIVIGISLDEDERALTRFLKQRKIDWPQAMGSKGGAEAAANAYGVSAIPATFLIDAEGVIRATDLRGSGMKRTVADLLEAASPN